jgi:hypothetical protein
MKKMENMENMEKEMTIPIPQIGYLVEKNILQYVFYDCYRKPFRIRTLKHLRSFLENPKEAAKKDKCDEKAPEEWHKKLKKEKEEIIERLSFILDNHADILGCIDDLKYCSQDTDTDTDADIVEALQTCRPFYFLFDIPFTITRYP